MIIRLKKAHQDFSITELCRIFGISQSTFFYQSDVECRAFKTEKIVNDIKNIAELTGNTYGRRRMNVELNNLGYAIGIFKTAALMKKAKVVALSPKKQHYYPNSGEECRYAPNLLKRQFNPETLNTHAR